MIQNAIRLVFFIVFTCSITSISEKAFLLNINLVQTKSVQVALKFEEDFNYFEAITEYKRNLFLNPGIGSQLKIAELYMQSGNYDKAAQYYKKVKESLPGGDLKLASELSLLQTKYKGNTLSFQHLQQFKAGHKFKQAIDHKFRLNTLRFLLEKEKKKTALAITTTLDKNKFDPVPLQKFLSQKPRQIHYSALFLSMVPGGYFYYDGELKKGALATATVSILGIASVLLFQSGAVVGAVVAAAFSFRFYANSIQESAKHRVYSNYKLREQYFTKAIDLTGGEVDFADAFSFRFTLLK